MNLTAPDPTRARFLTLMGTVLAGPAFLINWVGHGGELPANDIDRLDGTLSVLFALGTTMIILSLLSTMPSPLGRKGRIALRFDAVLAVLAIVWAVCYVIDPNANESNPLIAVTNAAWPIHQAFMLVIGIAAIRAARWPRRECWTILAPAVSVVLAIGLGHAVADILGAIFLGAGWALLGLTILQFNATDRAAIEPGAAYQAA